MSDIEQIGQIVKSKASELQRKAPGLISRGMADIARLQTDPHLRHLLDILRRPRNWNKRIYAWQKIREMNPRTPGWKEGLQRILYEENGWSRILAAEALAWHSIGAMDAIPVLAATLEITLVQCDFEWARVACGALGKYKPARQVAAGAIPALTDALDAEDADVRCYAATALGNWGEVSRTALVKLARLADRAPPPLRNCYIKAMGKIDSIIETTLDAMIAALNDPDSSLRQQALIALGEKGSEAWNAWSELQHLFGDQDPAVRKHLALLLGLMQVSNDDVLKKLEQLSQDSERIVQLAAASAFAKLGIDVPRQLKIMRQALKERDPELRTLGAKSIEEMGDAQRLRNLWALKKTLRKERSIEAKTAIEKAIYALEKHP